MSHLVRPVPLPDHALDLTILTTSGRGRFPDGPGVSADGRRILNRGARSSARPASLLAMEHGRIE